MIKTVSFTPRIVVFCAALLLAPLQFVVGQELTRKSNRGAATASDVIKIPFERYQLPNGLTVILSVDRATPTVAVDVWYHVGSKNEVVGRTGFAHLFEHVMFTGSANVPYGLHDKLTEGVGGNNNGSTTNDRTNYYEIVPSNYLESAIWLESDRMGWLLDTLDIAKLNAQRDIVKNERRQRVDNQPYGRVGEIVASTIYPKTHPYSWPVIGSMEDLNAASLADVKDWFKTYYGAANATLTIAGDVQADDVFARVQKYFGWIPSGPPVAKHTAWVAKRTGTHRQRAQDRVPQARIYKVWNIPQYGTRAGTLLNLASDVLAQGKSSRFYKRLVYEDQIATDASAVEAMPISHR